jgi:hypothetical protein
VSSVRLRLFFASLPRGVAGRLDYIFEYLYIRNYEN